MTKRAWCLVRDFPHYRRSAFVEGLQKAGYSLKSGEPGQDITCADVLVTWNRYGHYENAADRVERQGGRVIVAENGYLGAAGSTPKFDVAAGDVRPGHYYAMALGHHNGGGTWPADDGSRWRALGITLAPWRESGGAGGRESDKRHILICPQRGIGPNRQAQHPGWAQDVTERLKKLTRRPVRIRPHPGLGPGAVPIAQDLAGCWAVVTWASGAGIHALVAGIPVFAEAKHWILQDAALRDISLIEGPPLPAREPAFERLACAQWTVAEIASGEPFRRLLGDEATK